MIDLKLDKQGDLALSNNDLVWVDGAERVHQQLQIKLRLWQGEWFLNTLFGTPYITPILGKTITLNGAIAALKHSIYEVEGVEELEALHYELDSHTRTLNIGFTARTPYGLITYHDHR